MSEIYMVFLLPTAFLVGGLLYRIRGGGPWAPFLSTTGGRLVFAIPTALLPLAFGTPWWIAVTLLVSTYIAIVLPNEGREDLGTAPRNIAGYITRPLPGSTLGDAAGMALIGAERGAFMGLGLLPVAPAAVIICLAMGFLAGASYGLAYIGPLRYRPALWGTFDGYTSYAEFATGGLWWLAIITGITFAH